MVAQKDFLLFCESAFPTSQLVCFPYRAAAILVFLSTGLLTVLLTFERPCLLSFTSHFVYWGALMLLLSLVQNSDIIDNSTAFHTRLNTVSNKCVQVEK